MEIEAVEVCLGFVTGLFAATFTARDRVSYLLPRRSFWSRVLGREDK